MPTAKRKQDAVETVGNLLGAFLKSGPQSSSEASELEQRVLDIIRADIISVEQSTEDYKARCDAFLKTVIKNGGLPIRAVSSVSAATDDNDKAPRRRKSGKEPVPTGRLYANHKTCIDNYRREARLYLEGELASLRELLSGVLRQVPAGGAKDPAIRRKVTAIKRAFRDVRGWDRLFSTIKNHSFPASLQRTFDLKGNPIAAIWRYSTLDEQGEFRNAYSHKDRADRIYAVRGNWALEKGLMKPGPHGFIDETVQPGEEFDCMCRFQWLYALRELPDDMRTAKGDAELKRVRRLLDQDEVRGDSPAATERPGMLQRILRWIVGGR